MAAIGWRYGGVWAFLLHDPTQYAVRSFKNSRIKTGFLGHFIKVHLSKDED